MQNGGAAGPSGISHPEPGGGVNVLDYSTDFPELPDNPNGGVDKLLGGAWNKPPAVRSEKSAQAFRKNHTIVSFFFHTLFFIQCVNTFKNS